MSYYINEAVRSLMLSFPRMGLSDKLLSIGVLLSYAGAGDEDLAVLARYAVKARELELYLAVYERMYERGEVPEVPIPTELKEIYIAIMKYLGRALRKLTGGDGL